MHLTGAIIGKNLRSARWNPDSSMRIEPGQACTCPFSRILADGLSCAPSSSQSSGSAWVLLNAFQLHIRQAPRLATNKHDWPHEHIGTARVYGDAGWLRWDYAQALAHFCRQTNISFVPPVNDPEYFELTRS